MELIRRREFNKNIKDSSIGPLRSELKAWLGIFNKYLNEVLAGIRIEEIYEKTTDIYGRVNNKIEILNADNKNLYDHVLNNKGIERTKIAFKRINAEPNMETYLVLILAYSKILKQLIKEGRTGLEFEAKLFSDTTGEGPIARFRRSRMFTSLQDIAYLLSDFYNRDKESPQARIENWKEMEKDLKIKEKDNNGKVRDKMLSYLEKLYEELSYLVGREKAKKILFRDFKNMTEEDANFIFKKDKKDKIYKYGFFQVGEFKKETNMSMKKKYMNMGNLEDIFWVLYYICEHIEEEIEQKFKGFGDKILSKILNNINTPNIEDGQQEIKTLQKNTKEFKEYLQKVIAM